MSLTRNILANYVSQIYVTLIGIVMVPLYLTYMGAEAYGLVGFFSMLQAWFNLLDIGLSPTVARQTAYFRGGALDAPSYRNLLRALEGIFFLVALSGGSGLFAASNWIATNWLIAKQIPTEQLIFSIKMMAISVALRWMSGLYRGQISGSERLVFLSSYNAIIATIRFVGILPVFVMIGTTPTVFFTYQLLVAIVELLGLIFFAHKLLPALPAGNRIAWSWTQFKPVLKFSLSIAFTSSVWVLVTQTDKLVLSKILPLTDYGYFTLAVLVASGIMIISGPVSGAIMPRMVKLEAEGDQAGMIRIYRKSTQLVAVIAGSAAVTISWCAESLLWIWTGDKVLAQHAAPILILYAIGNGILALSAFPYYLQYAKGNLRLHLIGNVGFVLFLIPTIIYAASRYGAIGAGYTWMAVNLLYFVLWVPLVHRKFEPGLNKLWFGRDLGTIIIAIVSVGYLLSVFIPHMNSRLSQSAALACFGVTVLLAGASASSVVWEMLKSIPAHRG